MQTNPALWERGKRLLRDSNNDVLSNLWNEIAQSEAYGKKWQAQGKTQEEIDNLIASEVHSRLTGESGGELLQHLKQAFSNGSVYLCIKSLRGNKTPVYRVLPSEHTVVNNFILFVLHNII